MSDVKAVGIGGLANAREDYVTSRYDYYADYTFEDEVKHTDVFEYYPQSIRSDYDATVPIHFNIPAEIDWFTKSKTFKLHGGFSVTNETENTKPANTEVWSVINNAIHSMFSSVDVLINDHVICDRY